MTSHHRVRDGVHPEQVTGPSQPDSLFKPPLFPFGNSHGTKRGNSVLHQCVPTNSNLTLQNHLSENRIVG